MTAIWYKIWRRIRHTVAIVLLLIALCLGLALSLTPLLSQHRLELQTWISKQLQQPVEVQTVTARWRNLGPRLEFSQVNIFNDEHTQILLAVDQLDVDVNVWRSLIKHKIIFNRIGVAGTQINLKQTDDGQIILLGHETPANQDAAKRFSDLLDWLGSEQHLQLTNIRLNWQDKDHKLIILNPLQLNLSNHGTRHRLQGEALLEHIPLQFYIDAKGELNNFAYLQADITANAKGVPLPQWLNRFEHLHLISGMADVKVTARWQQQQWQRARVQFYAKDLHLQLKDKKFASQLLSGTFAWQRNISGIDAELTAQQSILDFGSLFRTPLPLQKIHAIFNIQQQAQGWLWQVSNLFAQQEDVTLQGKFSLRLEQEKSPWIDLQTQVKAESAKQLSRYLPTTLLSKNLTHWLDHAIQSAHKSTANILLQGRLTDFPFIHNNGKFSVLAKLNDVNLHYWQGWPQAEHLTGTLAFTGQRMDIDLKQGQICHTPISGQAYIPVLNKHSPAILHINGQAQGNLQALQQFMQSSPLQKRFASLLKSIQLLGPMQMKLDLTLPLEHEEAWQLNGHLTSQHSQIQVTNSPWSLTDINGSINFTGTSLSSEPISAKLLGSPVELALKPTPVGNQLTINGELDVNTFAKALNQPPPSWASGRSAYQASLQLTPNKPTYRLNVATDLRGITLNLPTPLAKPAAQAQKLQISADMQGQSLGKLTAHYGNNLQLHLYPNPLSWQIDLQHPQISGRLAIPKQGLWQANLQRLYLTPEHLSQSSWQPSDIPALKLISDDTRYGAKHFGRVQLELAKINDGVQIKQLQSATEDFTLNAYGTWRQQGQKQMAELAGVLTSPDIAGTLQSVGLPPRIIGNHGQVQFNLQWPGAIYAPRLRYLKGQLSLNASSGRIVNLGAANGKMDLGKLLSILSLQTLTRHLSLDFSDLTKQGYSFDKLQGDFNLNAGNAITHNLFLNGPVAQLELDGRIGIVKEDYALQVKVTPHLTSSLPVIAALAGGPIVGAITWAADRVIGAEINKIATYFYQVNGGWENPQITEIKRVSLNQK